MVGGKLESVGLQELAGLDPDPDLPYKLALRTCQDRGHDRGLAATEAGGSPNADFRNDAQLLVQYLFDRLLGPHGSHGIDNVIGGS